MFGLSEMASNLFSLVRSRSLLVYPDADMRRAVLQTVASENGRFWKLSKEKQFKMAQKFLGIKALQPRGEA